MVQAEHEPGEGANSETEQKSESQFTTVNFDDGKSFEYKAHDGVLQLRFPVEWSDRSIELTQEMCEWIGDEGFAAAEDS